jgi:hypothetical protein
MGGAAAPPRLPVSDTGAGGAVEFGFIGLGSAAQLRKMMTAMVMVLMVMMR